MGLEVLFLALSLPYLLSSPIPGGFRRNISAEVLKEGSAGLSSLRNNKSSCSQLVLL